MYIVEQIIIGIITNVVFLIVSYFAKNLYTKMHNYCKQQIKGRTVQAEESSSQEVAKSFYFSLVIMVSTAGLSLSSALPLGIRIVFAVIAFVAFLSAWGSFDALYEITKKLENNQR